MSDLLYFVEILFLLAAVLGSCLVFANAIEHLGESLNLGNQVTGSILAAVGTALPETIIPLIAIFVAGKSASEATAHGIAVGSIIGAPFMLSTLAFFVTGITIFLFRKSRGTTDLQVNIPHVKRDLSYFLVSFSLLILASTLTSTLKVFIAVSLGLIYAFYVFHTINAGSEYAEMEEIDLPKLYLTIFGLKENKAIIILQTFIGLFALIFFAEKFVHVLEDVSNHWGISPLVLSLIITPLATELPEKVNSCIWVSQKKDTLAVGNITGAMVFQSSIPGVIGILFTPWHFDFLTSVCSGFALLSGVILLIYLNTMKRFPAILLLPAVIPYIAYIYLAFFR